MSRPSKTHTTEEINTSVDLNSQVELVFRSDYVPLARLAGVADVERIRVNTLNPAEEARLGSAADSARTSAARQQDSAAETATGARLAAASRGSAGAGIAPAATPAPATALTPAPIIVPAAPPSRDDPGHAPATGTTGSTGNGAVTRT